jgi:hypothetical protein
LEVLSCFQEYNGFGDEGISIPSAVMVVLDNNCCGLCEPSLAKVDLNLGGDESGTTIDGGVC